MVIDAIAQHAADIPAQDVWIAGAIFVATYGIILTERVNRAIVALLGAGLMILLGVVSQGQAFMSIDGNTIGLLLGMMIVVAVMKESGVFQYVAVKSAKVVKADPIGTLMVLAVVTAMFSALLDNVTTVLLTTPVIIQITREMRVNSFPYLFTSILASNIGGTATLIGDPPNIMIGSAAHLSFMDFIYNVAPVSLVVLTLTLIPVYFMWRKELVATPENRTRIMQMDENACITDVELLVKSLFCMGLILIGFIVGHSYHIMPATIALTGAGLLLLLDNIRHHSEKQHEKIHAAISESEWVTLFFFAGLFIIVHAVEHVGIIDRLAQEMLAFTGGDKNVTLSVILWGAAILSAIVDNIPFVATMIPLIQSMGDTFGGDEGLRSLWWALSLGACLGGNGSLIGASANLVVAGLAEKDGHGIGFVKFMLYAFPLMLMSIVISQIYLWLRYM